jgi:hypothetical protein
MAEPDRANFGVEDFLKTTAAKTRMPNFAPPRVCDCPGATRIFSRPSHEFAEIQTALNRASDLPL